MSRRNRNANRKRNNPSTTMNAMNNESTQEITGSLEEQSVSQETNPTKKNNIKWLVCSGIVCGIILVAGLIWWAPWTNGAVGSTSTAEAETVGGESASVEVISNNNGAGNYFQYSSTIDKNSKQFLILGSSTTFKAAEGELFEFSMTMDTVKERPQMVLGRYILHPEFGLDAPKETTDISLEGHEPVIPTLLTLQGDSLKVAFDKNTDVEYVVIYPQYDNQEIGTIKDFSKAAAIFVDTTAFHCDTLRIAAKDHISALVKTSVCKGVSTETSAAEKDEPFVSNIWAFILTVCGALGLLVVVLVALFARMRKQEEPLGEDGEGEAEKVVPEGDAQPIDDIISILEKQIEEKTARINELNRLIAESEQLEGDKNTSDESTDDTASDGDSEEQKMQKPQNTKEIETWYKTEIYEKEGLKDSKEYASVIEKINGYLSSDSIAFQKELLKYSDELYAAWEALQKSFISEHEKEDSEDSVEDENALETATDTDERKSILELKNELSAEQANLDKLKTKLLEEQQKEMKASDTALKTSIKEMEERLRKLQNENSELLAFKQKANDEIAKAKNEAAAQISRIKEQSKADVERAEAKAQKQITAANEEAQQKIHAANDRAKKAEEKSKTIKDEVTKLFENQIAEKNQIISSQKTSIGSLTTDLSQTRRDLSTTQSELKSAQETIVAKEKALDRFNKTITDIAPAKEYAESLERLLKVGKEVESAAISLGQNKDIDDYLINKYIARYRGALSAIDMQMFTTDVLNAAKAQFVYKGQMLSTFDQKDKKAFHESMKLYFYDTYLKKYIDALIVLNETMAGMQYLADGASAKDVKVFSDYRKEIEKILKAIEIEVISVKIMDSCADNLSLTVIPKPLDFDCPKNSICQIDNCVVYLKGASKPNEKVQVIVKK